MSILRGIARWFLAVVMVMAFTAWVSINVLNATILDRTVTKQWLQQSGIYQNVLNAVVRLQDTGNPVITKTELQQALSATFPASYVQQQTETVMNAGYDWVEGKSKTITFSIPVEQKRADFSANLAKAIEPKLAALPACSTRINPDAANPTCIPQGMTAAELAKQITQLAEGGDFLDKPITNTTIDTGNMPQLTWLPTLVANISWLLVALPAAAVVCAAGFVLLSDNKLRGLGIISRRAFFNGLLVVIGGAVVWYFGGTTTIGDTMGQDAILADPINKLLHQALPAIGQSLALTGGCIAIAGLTGWVTAHVLRKRQQPKLTIDNPGPHPAKPAPTPPAAPPTPPSAPKDLH